MKTMRTSEIWDQLILLGSSAWPAYQRVDQDHPIDFYVGLSAEGARLLVLVTEFEPPSPISYSAFDVAKAVRADGRWTISVILRRTDFVHVFGHLCDDLIASSRTGCPPREAARFLLSRIQRWHQLLGRNPSGLLDISEIRGLIGELLFLMKFCELSLFPGRAIQAWEGPLDAPQDFRFSNRFVEVKTCGPLNSIVWISSAEQLDLGNLPIALSVAVLEAADPATGGAFTLFSLVENIIEKMGSSTAALAEFNEKLRMNGYSSRDEYRRDCFKLRTFRHFDVLSSFPRIERTTLPEAILETRYRLDLSKCQHFERPELNHLDIGSEL